VAAQVASELDEICSLVMISTPAGTLGENTQWQRNNAINKIEDTAILESFLESAQIFDDVVAGNSAFEANSMDQQAAEFVRSTKDISVRQFANVVNCPTLLIHGARDEQVPVSDMQKLEHEIGIHGQCVRAVVFEELGHFLKYRDSGPAQVRKVLEFDWGVADLILSMPR
jgi:pimeloyl-ACP methyl ester carboxylesterase